MAPPDPATRERILEAGFACVGRYGLAKTTIEDVAKESGLSRATIYRAFPGGREHLEREIVAWEMGRFVGALAEAVAGAPDFPTLVDEGLMFARRAILGHDVLQKVLATEPDRLLPLLTTEQHRPLRFVVAYLRPFLEREQSAGRLVSGLDLDATSEFVARMILSLVSSPGRWDLADPVQVRALVRGELLAGVSTPEARGPMTATGSDVT